MKINIGALATISAGAILLTLTIAMHAQTAAPTATPKPPAASADDGFDLTALIGAELEKAKIYFRRGSNCDAKKDYACAVDNYSRSITADPTDRRVLFLRAKAEMSLNRNAEAIADLNKGLKIDPKNDAGYGDLGIIYETSGQYDKAMENYRLAIKAAPQKVENYEWMATRINAIFKQFADKNETVPPAIDLNEALSALNAALKLQPTQPVNYTAYQERAVTYRNLARTGKQVNGLAEADEMKASEQQMILLKQIEAKTKEWNVAVEKDLEFQRSLTPYFKAHDYAVVVKLTTDAISQHPTAFRAYNNRALAYVGLHKYREAIADSTKAVELYAEFSEGFSTRGIAKVKSGDFMGAVMDYDRAIELDPSNIAAVLERGGVYMVQGEYDLAETDFLRTLDLDPKKENATSGLASLAELKKSGYNTGKIKDDAFLTYVKANNTLQDADAEVKVRFDLFVAAANEQPRDNAKVCRLLAESDVSLMVLESLVDKMKEFVYSGRMDKLTNYKIEAMRTFVSFGTYRSTLSDQYAKQGCKK